MIKELLKDASIYGLSDFLFKAVSFLTFPIYAYLLSLEEFSVMSLVTTLVYFAGIFFNIGNINNSVQRYYWDEEGQNTKKLVVSTGLICLLMASLVLGGIFFALFIPLKATLMVRYGISSSTLLYAFLGGILTNIFSFALNVLRLHFAPWQFFLLSVSLNALMAVLSILFVFSFNLGIEGYFLGIVCAYAVFTPLALWAVNRDLGLCFDITLAKKLMLFSYPFIFMSINYWIGSSFDRWMLAEMVSLEEVGLYSVAFRFATVINLFVAAFGQAFSPLALKNYSEKPSLFSHFMHQTFVLWVLCLLGLWSLISLFSNDVLHFMLPEAYWGASNSLIYLCLGTAVLGISQLTAFPITLAKKTQLFNYASILAVVINIVLNWLWIPTYGAVGAAIASACSYAAVTFSYSIFSYFLPTRFPLDIKFLGIMIAYCAVTLFLLQNPIFQEVGWYNIALKACYLGGFLILAVFIIKQEKIMLSKTSLEIVS